MKEPKKTLATLISLDAYLDTIGYNTDEIKENINLSKEELSQAFSLPVVSNSVICCPQCGNERLESTGSGWYICCDKDCDWGDKL